MKKMFVVGLVGSMSVAWAFAGMVSGVRLCERLLDDQQASYVHERKTVVYAPHDKDLAGFLIGTLKDHPVDVAIRLTPGDYRSSGSLILRGQKVALEGSRTTVTTCGAYCGQQSSGPSFASEGAR